MTSLMLKMLVLAASAFLLIRWFEWKSVYYPTRALTDSPDHYGLSFEDVFFETSDRKKLHGWWFPHEKARGNVLMFHGNGGNISTRIWMARDFQQLGLNVLLFDYRGYGRSRGLPGEQGTYADARAAHEEILRRSASPVIFYGRSLGGAVALQRAVEQPPAGLILESTFTSIPDMAAAMYPFLPLKHLCSYRYDNLKKISDVHVPLLMAHSTDDALVPFAHGRKLFESAGSEDRTFVTLSGDHNRSGWLSTPAYWTAISTFISSVLEP